MQNQKKTEGAAGASQTFNKVRQEVSKEFPQTPQYGAVTSAGYETSGDFIIESRSYR